MNRYFQAKLIQSIYDHIFFSYTGDSSSNGSPYTRDGSFMILNRPGIPIDPKQYDPQKGPAAAENFSNLVNDLPLMSIVKSTPTGMRVDTTYGMIIDGAHGPDRNLPPNEKLTLDRANALLKMTRSDGTTVETPTVIEYKKKQSDYVNAFKAYYKEKFNYNLSDSNDAAKWTQIEPTLLPALRNAWQDWLNANKNEVESAQAVISQYGSAGITKRFADLKFTYEHAALGSTIGGPQWRKSNPIPDNWYDSSGSFEFLEFDSAKLRYDERSRFSAFGGTVGFGAIFSIGGGAERGTFSRLLDLEAENIKLTMEYNQVSIDRTAWMDTTPFYLSEWEVSGYNSGYFSTGQIDVNNKAPFALLPTSFIVSRNVTVKGSWSRADIDVIQTNISAKGGFGFGPFRIGGHYNTGNTNETFSSEWDGSTIGIRGLQIIAWLGILIPRCAPGIT